MTDRQQIPAPGEEKNKDEQTNDKPLDKEIHDLMSDAVGPLWEKMNIDTAVVLARIPGTDNVSVYYRGHFYDVATLLAQMNSKFTAQIDRELGRGSR